MTQEQKMWLDGINAEANNLQKLVGNDRNGMNSIAVIYDYVNYLKESLS